MDINFWNDAGHLIAEVKSDAVPRVGELIDVDNQHLVVHKVKWVVAAEQMEVDVTVGLPTHGASSK